MARTNNLTNFLSDVADAIKEKKGSENSIPAANFDSEIRSIPRQGAYQEKQVVITANGSTVVVPDADYDAMTAVGITTQVPEKKLQTKNYEFTENATLELLPDENYDGFTKVGLAINVSGGPMDPTTATIEDVISPKTFYSNGRKLTGNIATEKKAGTSLDSYDTYANASNLTGYQINDYDIKNKVYVTNINNTSWGIGRLVDNEVTAIQKTYTAAQLNPSGYNIRITDIKFSNVYSEDYIKVFVSARSSANTSTSYPANGHIFLVFINKISLEIEKTYMCTYGNYLDGYYTKEGSLAVHPLKDVAVAIFLGTANGNQVRYMASLYNSTADTFANIMTGTQGSSYNGSVSFVNSYINNTGYATFIYGTSSSAYETLVFKITESDSCSLLIRSQNLARWYTNDDTYILNGALYNVSGGKIKDVSFSGLYATSRVHLLDNLIIYSTRSNGTSPSNNISMINAIDKDAVYLGVLLQNEHPIFYVKDEDVVIANPANTLVSLYKATNEIVTALIYRSNKYYNGSDETAVANDLLAGKTAISKNGQIVGTMSNNGSVQYTPTTSQQNIANGYHNGSVIKAVTSDIDINIIPNNIKNGVVILGVEGTFVGSTGGDATSDANLQAKYLLTGYSMVADGQLIQGTMPNYGDATINPSGVDVPIPEGYYHTLTIPVIQASSHPDYDECNDAILAI